MTEVMAFAVSVLLAYLIGAIPMGYVMSMIFKGKDIRKQGSGNVGATNVLRTVGKIPALITLIFDISKGAIVVQLIGGYAYQYLGTVDQDFYRCLLGLVAICGHIWPVFLKFKGGKGVATTIGVMAVISPITLLSSLAVWIIFFLATSYVSVSSLAFGVALPTFAAIFNQPLYIIIFAVTLCVLNTYKHKENIKRLSKGEESKIIIFKKSQR
jgi:acyl phosphate:glycerol-3-phosphate acyltransferase